MISINQAYRVFNEYVKDYDIDNPKVLLKVKHTYSVVDKAKGIASSLMNNQEEIDLACLIALLHDIGRFEQLKRYNSFYDNLTIDHGDLGVELLFKEQLITKFIESRKYDTIIYKAIKNHNKFKIEDGLSKKELLHAKIIRDADKIDNLEIKCTLPLETIYDKGKEAIEQQLITKEVFDSFINHTSILSSIRKTDLDVWLSHFAFIFDLQFPYSFKEVLHNNYIDTLAKRLDYKQIDTIEKMKIITKEVKQYASNHSK